MKYPIGFVFEEEPQEVGTEMTAAPSATPAKSLAQVFFPEKGQTFTYFNDLFDLKRGDIVFVEGKLEGIRGVVREVNKNFKIKVSDYKKVIAVVDTDVGGQFYLAGSHFVTFDASALPAEKVKLWFKAPEKEEDEFVSSCDDSTFWLSDPKDLKISSAIAERGQNYYLENRVCYLCLDGTKGFAIVEGSKAYTVEFRYQNGEISHLICDCPCTCTCKHEFSAMLQLRETLELIEKHYAAEHTSTDYFAAVAKGTLFSFAIDGKETGSFTL